MREKGKQRARVDEMEAQRVRAPWLDAFLQKPLRTEPCNRVYYCHRFPPENPAGHRKAYRRVAQVHDLHNHPQIQLGHVWGKTYMTPYRHNTNGHELRIGHDGAISVARR